MANTYTQIYIHVVTAVKYRSRLIHPSWRRRLEAQIKDTIEERGHEYIEGFAMPDHIHTLIGMHTRETIAELTGAWKGTSSSFLQNEGICKHFQWQKGYGAFSVGHRELEEIKQYIRNQAHHHRGMLFKEEYEALLHEHGVGFNEVYVLDDLI